jgi:hypothetical protein
MKNEEKKECYKCLPLTKRFCVSGGVAPRKLQCDFGGFVPARAAVSRHPRKAAATLGVSGGATVGKIVKT